MKVTGFAVFVLACNPTAARQPEPCAAPLAANVGAASPSTASSPALERFPSRYQYRLSFGGHALLVDPSDGGRIVGLSLDGRNVLLPREEFPLTYGSSFWPSPQSDWNWPPPVEFDAAAWSAEVRGSVLRLESQVNAALGLSAAQRISADPARELFTIVFTLENHGAVPRRVAPWQNTRVRPRGLTFFPARSGSLAASKLLLQPEDGVIWFHHDPTRIGESAKAFVDGEDGWLAQLDGDLLFLKVFPPVPAERAAPGEAEIEIYVDGQARFVEVEQQGPYDALAPGASSHWTVHWLVRRVPPGVVAESGSATLLDWVRTLVASAKNGGVAPGAP